MKRLLLVDNYDSFVYNIPQVIARKNTVLSDVVRNDQLSSEHFNTNKYSHVIISPGPGCPTNPQDFGGCRDVIDYYLGKKPILGICLGHQGIAFHFGSKIQTASRVIHGQTSNLKIINESPLWEGIESHQVMRYHSLVVEQRSMSEMFTPIAVTDDEHEELMAYQCEEKSLYAVQFHPESIETPCGEKMLSNFINLK